MSGVADRFQEGLKRTTSDLILYSARAVSAAFVGLTIALVIQAALRQPEGISLAFVFSFLVTIGLFWRSSIKWTFTKLVIFDLSFVLVCVLLRLYVLMAPEA